MPPPLGSPLLGPSGYRLTRLLGSGRTAHVYEAEHPVHGIVALKLPRDELEREPTLQRMFRKRSADDHRALAPTDREGGGRRSDRSRGVPLALEYCDTTLSALAAHRLPLEHACRLVLEIAQGLAHSHERQILHRDVKPANVFILAERAKLGDFGTGLYLSSAFSGEAPTARVGTAFYMAPETVRELSATPQSDLYSLGVAAYEVIAGVRPFSGSDEAALMLAHTSGVPLGLQRHRAEVGSELNQVVATAMARDPRRRFNSVQAFASAFAAAARLPETDAPPQVGRSGRLKPNASIREADAEPERFGWFGRKKSYALPGFQLFLAVFRLGERCTPLSCSGSVVLTLKPRYSLRLIPRRRLG